MPNINVNEMDRSTYKDQQFISISYYGKVNTPPQGGKTLRYKVTFTANGNLFYAIEVNDGQKISKPVNNPQSPSSELIFDRWILNGQPFDFENTVISSDLNLIATFKEQSSELFNKEITFTNIGHTGAMAYIMEPIAGIDDTHLYDSVINNDELGEILNLTFPMMLQPGDPDEGIPDMYQGYVEEETPDGDYYVIQFMYIPDGIIEPEEFGPDPIYGMLQIGSPKLPVEGTPPQTIANTIIRYSTKTQYEVTYDFGEEQITKSYLEGTVLSLQNGNLPEIPEILENEKFVGYYYNDKSLVDQSVTVNSNITINGMISEDYAYELYEHFNINKEDYPYMNIAVDTHSTGYEYSIYFAHNYSIETINNIKYLGLKRTGFPILYNKYIDWTEDVDVSTCINAVNIIKNNITELVEFTPLFPSPTARVISYNDNDYCNYINFNEWDMFTEDIGTYITTTPVLYTFNTPTKPIPPVIDNIYFDKAIADIKKYDVYNTNPIYANKKCKITIGENYEIDGFTGKGIGRNYFKPAEFINSIRIKPDKSTEEYNIEANFFQNAMNYSIPQSMITSDQDHFKIELVGDALPCGIYLDADYNRVAINGDADFIKGDSIVVTLTSDGHTWANDVEVAPMPYSMGNIILINVDSEYYDRQATNVTAKITLSDSTSYTWQFDNIKNGLGGNYSYL